jgi:hypothetical protein
MLRDRSEPADRFALVPPLGLKFEPQGAPLDRRLDEDPIVTRIRAAVARRSPRTPVRGRTSPPVAVLRRRLVVLRRSGGRSAPAECIVTDRLVLRPFGRIELETVPDATPLIRGANPIGPATLPQLTERVVPRARGLTVPRGRTLRVDPPAVPTTLPAPTDSAGHGGRRVGRGRPQPGARRAAALPARAPDRPASASRGSCGVDDGRRPRARGRPADRVAGPAGPAGAGASDRGPGPARGRPDRHRPAPAEPGDRPGVAAGAPGRGGAGRRDRDAVVAVRAAHADLPPAQGGPGRGIRPDDPARRGRGWTRQRLCDPGAGRRPGPAGPEGPPPDASPARWPGPESAGGRSRVGRGDARAPGAEGGCATGGDAVPRPGRTAPPACRDAPWLPPWRPLPRRDRRANPRAAAGFWPDVLPRPWRAGEGSVGGVGDPDAQPVEDRGSGDKEGNR